MEFGRPIEAFSEDELREYACEHVLYEVTHFVRATQAIEMAAAGLFPMNFAIEVFALHIRNLLDFFAPRNPRKTDACAADFYKEWKAPELNIYLQEARRMADKHVAHLTTDRTSDVDLKSSLPSASQSFLLGATGPSCLPGRISRRADPLSTPDNPRLMEIRGIA
jgi:hypothetical protein